MCIRDRYEPGRDQLSGSLRAQIERGRQVLAVDYRRALARVPILNNGFEPLFDEFDAILTPATAGTAPAGLASTGSPMFCTLWTLCGMPCISLPLLTGENGLPLGLQLVGRRGDDGRLLRTARWLSAALALHEAGLRYAWLEREEELGGTTSPSSLNTSSCARPSCVSWRSR